MAGMPVVNPLSHLGSAPRAGPPTGQMQGVSPPGAQSLEFFTPPGGAMQPGTFPSQGHPQQSVQPPMGGFPNQGAMSGSMQPGNFPPPQPQQTYNYDDDVDNEPPLLEELGINVDHIRQRMQGVAFFKKLDEDILRDADLSGPLVVGLALGICLLLAGKLQFGYVYGLGATGCVGVCMLINAMSQKGGIDLYRTMSILGYGLIPIVVLAFIGIFISLKSTFGTIASAVCISWSTATSSRFFATAIAMHQQRWLVAYPVGLVYTCFTLITVF